jgi:hypothetical protein
MILSVNSGYLNDINHLIYVIEACCILFYVRTELLRRNII